MKKFKKIAYITLWVVLVTGLVVSLGFINKEQDALLCKEMVIHVNQEGDLFFLDNIDVARLINDRGDSIKNQPKRTIDVADIEHMLNSHAAISNAEVSMSIDGVLKIDVKQRKPILRVINTDGESYYIDEEGKPMPLSDKYTANVVIASGAITEPYITRYRYSVFDIAKDSALAASSMLDELYSMGEFITKNEFWKAQVQQIYINPEKDMELVPLAGNQKIIFGDTTNMEEKFNKLFTFYQQGLNTTGWWDKYSTINLKFKNQIVCTKK